VKKDLIPASDPGRFDLKVGSTVVKAAAGDKDSGSTRVKPGTYTVREIAAIGQLSDYTISIACKKNGAPDVSGPGPSISVTVAAADIEFCTITNTRN